jgi:LPS sulfotransferase NodH
MTSPIRQPPVRYVILFPGRTGSTYLTDHLANHPQVCANYEILSQYQESWEQQKEFLDSMILTKRFANIEAVGFKTKLSTILDLKEFKRYLKAHEFRVIHLTRRNELKFVVSVVRAKLLRAAVGTSNLIDNELPELGPTVIPIADFAKARIRMRRQDRLGQIVDQLKLPTLRIAYEDLVQDEQRELNRLWRFLDLRLVATVGKTRKNTPHDIRSSVINLEEIISNYPEMARFIDQL